MLHRMNILNKLYRFLISSNRKCQNTRPIRVYLSKPKPKSRDTFQISPVVSKWPKFLICSSCYLLWSFASYTWGDPQEQIQQDCRNQPKLQHIKSGWWMSYLVYLSQATFCSTRNTKNYRIDGYASQQWSGKSFVKTHWPLFGDSLIYALSCSDFAAR